MELSPTKEESLALVAQQLKEADEKREIRAKEADERREARNQKRELLMGLAGLIITGLQVVALAWINKTYHLTNSMKTELVESVRAEATAAGILKGKEEKEASESK